MTIVTTTNKGYERKITLPRNTVVADTMPNIWVYLDTFDNLGRNVFVPENGTLEIYYDEKTV